MRSRWAAVNEDLNEDPAFDALKAKHLLLLFLSNTFPLLNRDRLTRERRSWNMSRIRGKDTAPERVIRSLLHGMGFRFRLHVRIPIVLSRREGFATSKRSTRSVSVDIVLPKYKTAIFVHGCFWHRHRACKNCTTPTNRRAWWIAKLEGNAARDEINCQALRKLGWRTLTVWECETENSEALQEVLERFTRHVSASKGNVASVPSGYASAEFAAVKQFSVQGEPKSKVKKLQS